MKKKDYNSWYNKCFISCACLDNWYAQWFSTVSALTHSSIVNKKPCIAKLSPPHNISASEQSKIKWSEYSMEWEIHLLAKMKIIKTINNLTRVLVFILSLCINNLISLINLYCKKHHTNLSTPLHVSHVSAAIPQLI